LHGIAEKNFTGYHGIRIRYDPHGMVYITTDLYKPQNIHKIDKQRRIKVCPIEKINEEVIQDKMELAHAWLICSNERPKHIIKAHRRLPLDAHEKTSLYPKPKIDFNKLEEYLSSCNKN
jgi:hypothetical protein